MGKLLRSDSAWGKFSATVKIKLEQPIAKNGRTRAKGGGGGGGGAKLAKGLLRSAIATIEARRCPCAPELQASD